VAPRALVEAWFSAYGAWLQPLPGAAAAVHELAGRGLRLGIVSNVPLPGFLYRAVLERLGLGRCFLDTRFSHDEGSRKPATVMLERCLAALCANADQAVMVGDRKLEDVGSGRALGCATVWLDSGYNRGPDPDAIVADLAGLPAVLEGWRADFAASRLRVTSPSRLTGRREGCEGGSGPI
jgi:FMN phosphatase YigB (HAD superfamily)